MQSHCRPLSRLARQRRSASVWTGPGQSVSSVLAVMSSVVLVLPRDTPNVPCDPSRPVVYSTHTTGLWHNAPSWWILNLAETCLSQTTASNPTDLCVIYFNLCICVCLDQELLTYKTHLAVVVDDVLLLGVMLFKKPKALSFQIRSGWNLARLFFKSMYIDWQCQISDMTSYFQDMYMYVYIPHI